MIHPDTELRWVSEAIGYGVFATRPIPRGTVVWVLDDLDHRFTPEQVAALNPAVLPQFHKYSYVDPDGQYVLCWDHGRFLNHSCTPASRGVTDAFEIAVRDLSPGDELTCEYSALNLDEPFPCSCGSPACRGTVRPDDLVRLHPQWDVETQAAFDLARTVAQPLLPMARVGPRDAEVHRALVEKRTVRLPSSRGFAKPR